MAKAPIAPSSARLVPVLAALAVLAAAAAVYLAGSARLWQFVMKHYGIAYYPLPFIDIAASLSAWDCIRQGIDVVKDNPCDVLGRTGVYTPLWLSLSFIPLGSAQRVSVALTIDALFLVSLLFLPPARTRRGVVLMALATTSSMTIFAVERCNFDVIMFLMALLAGYLLLGGGGARFLGYLVTLLAALTKYYPAVILLTVVRERLPRFFGVCAMIFALTALFLVHYWAGLVRILVHIPPLPTKGDAFGAENLPASLAEWIVLRAPSASFSLLRSLFFSVMLAGCGLSAIAMLRRVDIDAAFATMGRIRAIFLVIGALTIAGCFFAGQSIGYRGIFLLLALPGFIAMAERSGDPAARSRGLADAVVVVALMWGEFFRVNIDSTLGVVHLPPHVDHTIVWGFWAVRELAWWYLAGEFIAVTAVFVRSSTTIQSVARVFGRGLPAEAGDREHDG
jgi:hypothetical protein